jgi:acylphosphatase
MAETALPTQRGFVVAGQVQGVGFRWSACRAAESLGLRGTIRNLPDGRVEAHVAGPISALDRFEEWLRAGPSLARVQTVERVPSELELPVDFRIVF